MMADPYRRAFIEFIHVLFWSWVFVVVFWAIMVLVAWMFFWISVEFLIPTLVIALFMSLVACAAEAIRDLDEEA